MTVNTEGEPSKTCMGDEERLSGFGYRFMCDDEIKTIGFGKGLGKTMDGEGEGGSDGRASIASQSLIP